MLLVPLLPQRVLRQQQLLWRAALSQERLLLQLVLLWIPCWVAVGSSLGTGTWSRCRSAMLRRRGRVRGGVSGGVRCNACRGVQACEWIDVRRVLGDLKLRHQQAFFFLVTVTAV